MNIFSSRTRLFSIIVTSATCLSLLFTPAVFSKPRDGVEVFGSVGGAASELNNSTNVIMDYGNDINNTYEVNSQQRWGVFAGGGVELELKPTHVLNVLLGPAAYFIDFDKVQGVEFPLSNSGGYDTLDYRFSANSGSLFLESQWVFNIASWQPVFVLGIGSAWNRLFNYSETPSDSNGTASSATSVFADHTTSKFAYEVGASVQHALYSSKNHHVTYQASLGYRYFDFGQGQLSQSSLQTGTNQVLGIGDLHANVILVSLGALFR